MRKCVTNQNKKFKLSSSSQRGLGNSVVSPSHHHSHQPTGSSSSSSAAAAAAAVSGLMQEFKGLLPGGSSSVLGDQLAAVNGPGAAVAAAAAAAAAALIPSSLFQSPPPPMSFMGPSPTTSLGSSPFPSLTSPSSLSSGMLMDKRQPSSSASGMVAVDKLLPVPPLNPIRSRSHDSNVSPSSSLPVSNNNISDPAKKNADDVGGDNKEDACDDGPVPDHQDNGGVSADGANAKNVQRPGTPVADIFASSSINSATISGNLTPAAVSNAQVNSLSPKLQETSGAS
jgi:hypothetical protein